MIKVRDPRIRAINELLKPNNEGIRNSKTVENLGIEILTMYMNAECIQCKRCIAHKGECYGRLGIVPCLVYQPMHQENNQRVLP